MSMSTPSSGRVVGSDLSSVSQNGVSTPAMLVR
jgi:hypothetical protein